MEFRPCIDIHNGQVKQIVGGSLTDVGDKARENFVAERDAAYYAELYKNAGLKGGHIILLNGKDSEYYEKTKEQALLALKEYPGGLQVGGSITPDNAKVYLQMGASHVIVTSYVFYDGRVDFERLKRLVNVVGKKHLVLDLSCKRVGEQYRIVTNRWQKMTDEVVNASLMDRLKGYCDEFLIHAVDVEGKANGIELELVKKLGRWNGLPITYAGGVHEYRDLELLKEYGQDKLHVTIGSALDLFGGKLKWKKVLEIING